VDRQTRHNAASSYGGLPEMGQIHKRRNQNPLDSLEHGLYRSRKRIKSFPTGNKELQQLYLTYSLF
jgi:hypothetical protein